jgi:energy-coupling factor transport system ATP-binding protein
MPDVKAQTPDIEPVDTAVEEAIAVEGLSFAYRDAARAALSEVSFAQSAGEMIGVMGASGAGKSTLAKCLNRIIPELEGGEFRGIVRISGRPTAGARVYEIAPKVGMVFQDFESQLFSTSVAHEVAFALEQIGMSREEMLRRIGPALEAVGLAGFEERDPTSLSGGQKQRLAIAAVLALRPRIIVLDEPTTDLDPEGRAEVFALIRKLREQGLSLVVIEHEAEELRRCDRLVLLSEGSIIADGPPPSIMTRMEMLENSGVHPPGLNSLLHLLGIGGHARSIEHAEAEIRKRFPGVPSAPPAETPANEAVRASRGKAAANQPPGALIRVENVSFSYPGGPRVLDGADLAISAGEFVAIIGQNGSGKTTLAKLVIGLLKPDSGRITIDGRDRSTLHAAATAREIGYVFQNPDHQIFAATVEDEVAFGPRNFGLDPQEIERRCAEVLHAVGLENERKSDPFLLSKGQRQRLAVASVLVLRPKVLILDEPTTGLDYREQRRMMKLVAELNESGVAIVMITHTPWLVAEYARRVVLMHAGRKIFDDGVREFFGHDAMLAESSFRAPEVTALSRRFGTVALTAEEMAAWLREHCG